VSFAPSVPTSSAGTIDFSIGLTLNGIVPKKWVIDNIGGIGPALTANHSGNNGTIIWGASGPFTANGTFVNTGSLDDTGGGFNLTAQDFVNAPNGKVMVSSDGGFSSSGNFRNDGDLTSGRVTSSPSPATTRRHREGLSALVPGAPSVWVPCRWEGRLT